ncbi:cell wall-binding repeat-containing protein [Marisediminicola sp. LYQ134]|uniref:cell wall-binding repeat-containing protein n=1 Tax=Marisediminicola sp. LYQ134 TaxID=3391061 RepID=UPI0039833AED
MKFRALLTVVIAAALAVGGVTTAAVAAPQDEVLASVNSERAKASLAPLRADAKMDAIAQEWANQMSRTGNFAHSTNEWRAARLASGWRLNGENIAYGYRTSAQVMSGWMNSPGHRENILRSGYTRMGVGYSSTGHYWVQIFAGYPADSTPPTPSLSATPTPKITGSPLVGKTLTAAPGTWGPAPVTLKYQWYAGGKAIAGATKKTHLVTSYDVGTRVTVKVTGSKSGYRSVAKTSAATAAVTTDIDATRVAGASRYASAIALSKSIPVRSGGVVYVASGVNYPDALSAGPAAAHDGAPLLLTKPGALPAGVATEIARRAPSSIVVVGGESAVSGAVVSSLERIAPVTRVSGSNRFETSRLIAEHAFGDGRVSAAYLATGNGFPDALSAGSAAGAQSAPIVLVKGSASSVDSATLGLLRQLDVDSAVLVGGTSVVSAGIQRSLASAGIPATRQAGSNRFTTSAAINEAAFASSATAFIATGYDFPDALAGSVLAATRDSPLFISQAACIPRAIVDRISESDVTDVVLLGGESVLSDAVFDLRACSK